MKKKVYLLAIDPGTYDSAYCLYDLVSKKPVKCDIINNNIMLKKIKNRELLKNVKAVAIEMIASYGMPVGQTTFQTVLYIGMFVQAIRDHNGSISVDKIFRKDESLVLCNTPRGNDASIRRVIIDRYGPSKKVAIGNKKNPGILYGIVRDMWAALAVAITWDENEKVREEY